MDTLRILYMFILAIMLFLSEINFEGYEDLFDLLFPLFIYSNNNNIDQIENLLRLSIEIEVFSCTKTTKIISKYMKLVGVILFNEDIENWRVYWRLFDQIVSGDRFLRKLFDLREIIEELRELQDLTQLAMYCIGQCFNKLLNVLQIQMSEDLIKKNKNIMPQLEKSSSALCYFLAFIPKPEQYFKISNKSKSVYCSDEIKTSKMLTLSDPEIYAVLIHIVELAGYIWRASTRFITSVFAIHKDPDLWQNQNEHNTDWFFDDEQKLKKYANPDFGDGIHIYAELLEAK
ncbi:10376_t:CDS:2 [Ambispora gerdemannii]|uniref:10376_t:CDS:1 n=1 Tax=Ambispora gerdemannii TaxID=144530 RepID=A0A9N9CCW9_9GLOM|nr:10376_t:CDS:2 [Ambispora gerdemannii]